MKRSDRDEAIQLRRSGATYETVLQRFGMAKSTLWRWLKAEGMVETQPQRLTELKRMAQKKGAATVKAARLARTQAIVEQARQEVGLLTLRELWLMGVVLYWGEGAKQKPGNVSASVTFANSDPRACRLFLDWLKQICGIGKDQLIFEIYLHETANAQRARAYWAQQLEITIEQLTRVRWKRHRPATRRTNVGDSYYGLMRIKVRRSTALNRRITGWILGICDSLGSGVMVTHLALDQKIPGSIPGSPALLSGSATDAGMCQDSRGILDDVSWLEPHRNLRLGGRLVHIEVHA